MATIHLPQSTDLAELRRVMELMQRQVQVATTNAVLAKTNSGPGGGSSSTVAQGATGPAGPAGADGIANLDNIVMMLSEEEDILMDDNGDVMTDNNGYAMTITHSSWVIATDDFGNILTME